MPFSPTDLKCLLAWYNLGQGGTPYTETNCASFIATNFSVLSLDVSSAGWLDPDPALTKLTIAVDVMVNDAERVNADETPG